MAKTIDQLRALAAQIEDENRQGMNTQIRVGGLFMDIIDLISTIPAMQTVLGPLLQALNNSDLINPSDGQTLTFSLIKDGWTFSDAVTQLQIKMGQINSTVTSNYQAFLQAKDQLQGQIDDTDQRVRGYKTDYDQSQIEYSTWKSQTDTSISQHAVAIDKNTGDIISISGRVDTAYDQLDYVTNNLEASDKALNNLLDLTGLNYEDPPGSYTASWLYKNRQGIYGAAATFDDQGNIIQDSVLSVTVNGISSKAENALGQVTLVTQTVGLLQAEVTRNKEISDAGFTQLSNLINEGDESLEQALQREVDARTAEGQTTATRLNAVEGGLSVVNARFDEDGHPIGWSELKTTVDGLSSTVAGNTTDISALNTAINGTGGVLARLSTAESNIIGYADSASWIQQNKNSITATVGYFDANGNLISTGGLVTTGDYAGLFAQYMNANGLVTQGSMSVELEKYVKESDIDEEIDEYLSVARIDADKIKFDYNFDWTVTSGGSTVFHLDKYGNLTIKGDITAGSYIGALSVDSRGIYISEDDYLTDLELGYLAVHNPTGVALSAWGMVNIYGVSGSSWRTIIDIEGFSGVDSMIRIPNLPISKPSGSGYIYQDSGTLKIS